MEDKKGSIRHWLTMIESKRDDGDKQEDMYEQRRDRDKL